MRHTISGALLQSLTIELDPGDRLYSQTHSVAWMTAGVRMDTHTGGGLWEGVKRAVGGASFFVTEFSADRLSRVTFCPALPGTIVPFRLAPGQSIICRRESFLCAARSVKLELALQFQSVLGGQGLVFQKVTGPGMAWLHLGGEVVEEVLAPGETLRVAPGHLGACEPEVKVDFCRVDGLKNALLGVGSLFMAELTGPGRVWLQSNSLENVVRAYARPVLRREASAASPPIEEPERQKPTPAPAPRGLLQRMLDVVFDSPGLPSLPRPDDRPSFWQRLNLQPADSSDSDSSSSSGPSWSFGSGSSSDDSGGSRGFDPHSAFDRFR